MLSAAGADAPFPEEKADSCALTSMLPLLVCPIDGSPLQLDRAGQCLHDGEHFYPIRSGIPFLFAQRETPTSPDRDVTEIVKQFYEDTPFPNYDGLDTRDRLRRKASASVAGKLLDEQLPDGCKILEAGCGTGQMSNYLAMHRGRTVIGSDICFNSLRLANEFRSRFSINNASFVQMNLFDPFFKKHSFDVVISNGVLHHTVDAAAAFHSIQRLVKPGGYVLIGLYNWLGRLPTLWLGTIIRRFGDFAGYLDSRMRHERDPARRKAWFMDQYKHPHETKHSMDEVLRWFARDGFDFVSSIPTIGDTEFSDHIALFEPQQPGRYLDRLSTELDLLLSGGVDGGLYIMIGRKRT